MDLTPLETDLLGDIAQDEHAAWELVGFVRLHHKDEADHGRATAASLLRRWHRRGWLEVAQRPSDHGGYQAATITELIALLDAADLRTASWRGAETWLRLTAKVHEDVPWTAPAS